MKKQFILGISLLAVFSLAGCAILDPVGSIPSNNDSSTKSSEDNPGGGGGSSTDTPTSEEPDDSPFASQQTMKTYVENLTPYATSTIYFLKGVADVPYIRFDTFYLTHYFNFLYDGYASDFEFHTTKNADGVYTLTNTLGSFVIDVEHDTITANNPGQAIFYESYTDSSKNIAVLGTGLEPDYVFYDNSKSKQVGTKKTQIVFDLGLYHIDIIAYKDQIYMPLHTYLDIFLSNNTVPMSYNGKDLYYTGVFSPNRYPTLESLNKNSVEYQYFNTSPWKNKTTRSESLATFTYNELCFALDYIYGLKSFRNVSTFDELFTSEGVKTDLLSTNTNTYEVALNTFAGKWLFEGHSGYTKVSPYKVGTSYADVYYNNIYDHNSYAFLYTDPDTLMTNRYNAGMGMGLHVYNNTAVISFDTFMKTNTPNAYNYNDLSYDELDDICSELFFRKAFDEIKTNLAIENVVIDITCNGGGMVDAIPWLEAYMTDDPFMVHKHMMRGDINEVHYKVDLDRNGYINSNDTYKGDYNFFLMTSHYSFSCGNAFPTVIKDGGFATIIGERSGGGSCVVGGLATASGTVLRLSSTRSFMRKDGLGYIQNEEGIEPDYVFDRDYFYDIEEIDAFVNMIV